MQEIIRICIVDDNSNLSKLISEKISFFEEFEVTLISNGGGELLSKLALLNKDHLPHIILMDIEMPDMNGIELTKQITHNYPQIKVLMLTVFDHEEKVFNAILAGASGYFMKEEKIAKIIEGIHDALNGGAPMSSLIAAKALQLIKGKSNTNDQDEIREKAKKFDLTERELEILVLISKGLQNKEIAEKCFISPHTVKKHLDNIYLKLRVRSRMEAVNKIVN